MSESLAQPLRFIPIEEDSITQPDESGLFICRRPNGDCAIVFARTKCDAFAALNQSVLTTAEMLYPLDMCLLEFGLSNSAELTLRSISHATHQVIFETCYPALQRLLESPAVDDAFNKAAPPERIKAARGVIRSAVRRERRRLRVKTKKLKRGVSDSDMEIEDGFCEHSD